MHDLAQEERGIILLTGTTGSGKSTTLGRDHRPHEREHGQARRDDRGPDRVRARDKRSVINQREVGTDTASFKRALRRVLRQDPDVILVGEMRDDETVQTALSAAETGHLVLSTVHTVDATESINRLLEFFPPHQHAQARAMIAGTIKGVVSQRLVPGANGGRVAVCEILRMTGRVRDMIMDPAQTGSCTRPSPRASTTACRRSTSTFHAPEGRARDSGGRARAATSPHDFKLLVAADGRQGTSMADVEPKPRRAGTHRAPGPRRVRRSSRARAGRPPHVAPPPVAPAGAGHRRVHAPAAAPMSA